jgi:hypothetical protein
MNLNAKIQWEFKCKKSIRKNLIKKVGEEKMSSKRDIANYLKTNEANKSPKTLKS